MEKKIFFAVFNSKRKKSKKRKKKFFLKKKFFCPRRNRIFWFLGLKWPLEGVNKIGVNRKVVDIDEIYLNMRNEQNR